MTGPRSLHSPPIFIPVRLSIAITFAVLGALRSLFSLKDGNSMLLFPLMAGTRLRPFGALVCPAQSPLGESLATSRSTDSYAPLPQDRFVFDSFPWLWPVDACEGREAFTRSFLQLGSSVFFATAFSSGMTP